MCLAIPGKLIAITDETELNRSGKVDFGGTVRIVNLSCVPEAVVGEYVVVHVGMAISRMNEKEAEQVFRYLEKMGELEELRSDDTP